MQIHVSTDNHIHGSDALNASVSDGVQSTFERFAGQITRVDVHLADVNGPKGGSNDIRCLVEVRLAHHQPVVASHQAGSLDDAVDGAAEKAFRVVETTLARLHEAKGPQVSAGGSQVI